MDNDETYWCSYLHEDSSQTDWIIYVHNENSSSTETEKCNLNPMVLLKFEIVHSCCKEWQCKEMTVNYQVSYQSRTYFFFFLNKKNAI